ncbi:MAG TPA: hypothetical protein VHL78_04400 [Actinomycetota bacterium]|nr:hypothetical protein [Actinomycetota bacterium]
MEAQTKQVAACQACGSPVVEIAMEMANGGVTFRMCLSCESRSWERDGLRITRQQAVQHPPKR